MNKKGSDITKTGMSGKHRAGWRKGERVMQSDIWKGELSDSTGDTSRTMMSLCLVWNFSTGLTLLSPMYNWTNGFGYLWGPYSEMLGKIIHNLVLGGASLWCLMNYGCPGSNLDCHMQSIAPDIYHYLRAALSISQFSQICFKFTFLHFPLAFTVLHLSSSTHCLLSPTPVTKVPSTQNLFLYLVTISNVVDWGHRDTCIVGLR